MLFVDLNRETCMQECLCFLSKSIGILVYRFPYAFEYFDDFKIYEYFYDFEIYIYSLLIYIGNLGDQYGKHTISNIGPKSVSKKAPSWFPRLIIDLDGETSWETCFFQQK